MFILLGLFVAKSLFSLSPSSVTQEKQVFNLYSFSALYCYQLINEYSYLIFKNIHFYYKMILSSFSYHAPCIQVAMLNRDEVLLLNRDIIF